MRRFIAITSFLTIACIVICVGAISLGRNLRSPLILFRDFREGGDGYGGDLYLYDVERRFTARLTGDNHAGESCPVMSSDMRYIAYCYGSGTFHFFGLMQFDSLNNDDFPMILIWDSVGMAHYSSPVWSPIITDGYAHLAFVSNQDDEIDFREWRDAEIWVQDVPVRDWQPSDLFREADWDMFPAFADESNSRRRRLTQDNSNEDTLAWSPDGSQLAFSSDRDGNWEIYILDTDGVNQNIRRVTDNPATDTMPTWSADGRNLAFVSDRDSGQNIYRVDISSGEVSRLTFYQSSQLNAAWSPNGEYIAYTFNGTLYLMSPDGTNPQSLFSVWAFSWVP